MIEMISDLFKDAKEEIMNLIEWIKTFDILGRKIIEIKNVPGMKIINNLKLILSIIPVTLGLIVLYIKKFKRHL